MAKSMTPGTYVGHGAGFGESYEVEVVVDRDSIRSIRLVRQVPEPDHPSPLLEAAVGKLSDEVVGEQSLAVDIVSGASISSRGLLEAIADAVQQAGADPGDFAREVTRAVQEEAPRPRLGSPKLPERWDLAYDIVVVGSGFAALAAAHRAAQLGARTVIIEKLPMVGGNSLINGGQYAAYTSSIAAELQRKLHLEPDTAERHIHDTLVGGDNLGDPRLVRNFVYGSPFYLDILLENGLKVLQSLTRPGGHYGYRTYTTEHGVGAEIVQIQKTLCEKAGVEFLLDAKMTQIYREETGEGRVVGIRAGTKEGAKAIAAGKAVVLATGGFSANVAMRSRQVPFLTADLPTTNQPGATGEAISMAEEIGANTTQMDEIQLYPFADPDTGALDRYAVIPFSGPSSGVVYVDVNGHRYVNEGERRDVCAKAAQNSGGFPTFCIFNQAIVDNGGFITPGQLADGLRVERIFKADSLEGLSQLINGHTYKDRAVHVSGDTLAQTIATHNGYVRERADPDFWKVIDEQMLTMDGGPYYAIPQWPSVHHTMGGLTITEKTEVLDIWEKVIPGLLAAGEVTGGVHGTNRLGSNAVADCCVHGYIAGQMAATGTTPDFTPDGS